MKAYKATDNVCEYSLIVFADTANQAKAVAWPTDEFYETEYIDLRVKRAPEFDGLEHLGNPLPICGNAQIWKDRGWYCVNDGYCIEDCCLIESE